MTTMTLDILRSVVLPVLGMVALGAAAQRAVRLDVRTLMKLNLYLFVPAFLYVRVSNSTLSWGEIGGIGAAVAGPMAVVGLLMYGVLRRGGANGATIAAMVVGGVFYNAGNFGIPVAELAFGEAGGSVQALVVMFMNTAIFFAGYVILSLGQGGGLRAATIGYLKLPMIYAITAALIVRDTSLAPPAWVTEALRVTAAGMVPIALITLGAQLAVEARRPRWRIVGPVLVVKLLLMPAATAGAVWALGLWPWPGAQIILAAAAPTAVNILLLSIKLDTDAPTAADCIFWTTLLSAATVTATLAVIQICGGGPGM